jgi:chromosome partitioning protein
MAKKIVVTLRKGGSGKTTTAINLATALLKRGKRVLLVDLDPQSNATISVGIDPTNLTKHINTLFTDINAQTKDVIMVTDFGLHLIPAHPDLAETEAGMRATQIGLLKAILEPIDKKYDFIIIDTPPSESYLTANALAVADEVVIPLQAHFLALRGLQEVIDEIEQVKKGLNPKLKIAGILPTMVNQRTNISKTILDALKDKYAKLLYPISVDFSIRHTEASLVGLPIVLYDPKHQGSLAYYQLADLFLGKAVK